MLLEVLNGKSSIIHGSLVLEPAAHSRETFKELPKKRGGKEEEKLDSSSTLFLKHFPSISPIGGQPDQLCKDPPVHLNCDHLKMFQIGSTKTLFLTKSLLPTFAEYCQSQSHCFGNDSQVCCVLSCKT